MKVRKFLTWFLLAAVMVSCLSLCAFAADTSAEAGSNDEAPAEADGSSLDDYQNGTKTYPWRIGCANSKDALAYIEGDTFYITGTGETFYYDMFVTPAWQKKEFKHVRIGAGITRLGNCTFAWNPYIETVVFEGADTSFGSDNFFLCTGLTDVTLPANLTEIPDRTFEFCSSLKNIRIPETVTTLGYGVFDGCTNLSKINIPKGVTSLGEYCFSGTAIEELTVSDNVSTIPEGLAEDCHNLKRVICGEQTRTVEDYAFSYCEKLESIYFPVKLEHIRECAFEETINLKHIYYGGTDEQWLHTDIEGYGDDGVNRVLMRAKLHSNANPGTVSGSTFGSGRTWLVWGGAFVILASAAACIVIAKKRKNAAQTEA